MERITEEQAIYWCTILWEEMYKMADFDESLVNQLPDLKDDGWVEVCNLLDLDEDTYQYIEDSATCPCCAYVHDESLSDPDVNNGSCFEACRKYCPGMQIWGGAPMLHFHPCMENKCSPYKKLCGSLATDDEKKQAIQDIAEGFRDMWEAYQKQVE